MVVMREMRVGMRFRAQLGQKEHERERAREQVDRGLGQGSALRSGPPVSTAPCPLSSTVPGAFKAAAVRSALVPGFRLFGYLRDTVE